MGMAQLGDLDSISRDSDLVSSTGEWDSPAMSKEGGLGWRPSTGSLQSTKDKHLHLDARAQAQGWSFIS